MQILWKIVYEYADNHISRLSCTEMSVKNLVSSSHNTNLFSLNMVCVAAFYGFCVSKRILKSMSHPTKQKWREEKKYVLWQLVVLFSLLYSCLLHFYT